MNPVIFMPRVMPHIGSGGGGSNVDGLLPMLLTFVIVGVILYLLGILARRCGVSGDPKIHHLRRGLFNYLTKRNYQKTHWSRFDVGG